MNPFSKSDIKRALWREARRAERGGPWSWGDLWRLAFLALLLAAILKGCL